MAQVKVLRDGKEEVVDVTLVEDANVKNMSDGTSESVAFGDVLAYFQGK